MEKEDFLRRFGHDYGYPGAPQGIDELRSGDFRRLGGLVYLDHAGATLYSESQMAAVARDLTSNVYANPHSQSDCSMATSDVVQSARQQVLDYFNASPKDYVCIFTSGATAALKLVGESFPWSEESRFMYTMENHNSVLGIREYALYEGATSLAVDIEEVACGRGEMETSSPYKILEHPLQRRETSKPEHKVSKECAYHMFAFPSECNFSGKRFPLDLVNLIQDSGKKTLFGPNHCRGRWMVLIDAAKGCATEPPDLARYPADFVVFSFYKIFGYPTGLGALVVRIDAAKQLNKMYFSGGTVAASISDIDFMKRREHIEQVFEDGTVSFLSIATIRHGFKMINSLTLSGISRHTRTLAEYVRSAMLELKHKNGQDVCIIYGKDATKESFFDIGPVIAFNLRREDGSWIGYHEVEKLASLSRIQLRTGCFCNPGACAKYLGLSHSDLLANVKAGHVCWDDSDVIHGKPTGAVRISFGYMSTFEDAYDFLRFVVSSFVAKPKFSGDVYPLPTGSLPLTDSVGNQLVKGVYLKSITVYPVKSCAGFSVNTWPLSCSGLLYDREWLLKSTNGEIMTQKKVQQMCDIHANIDLDQGKLFLESPYCTSKLQISLQENMHSYEEIDVYGERYEVQDYACEVNEWVSNAIGCFCTLVRCSRSKNRMQKGGRESGCRDTWNKLTFVNEAQFLLISEESVRDLNNRLSSNVSNGDSPSHDPIVVDAMRFRPNLVISGAEPYAEDNWRGIRIGWEYFRSLGGCNRCQMVNLNQQSGEVGRQKSKEPLATLASYRRVKGRILFGIMLGFDDGGEKNARRGYGDGSSISDGGNERWLHVGQQAFPQLHP